MLFNLAAKAHFHKLEDFSDEEWAAAHQDEVDLVFYLTRAAWPQVPQAVAGGLGRADRDRPHQRLRP